VKSPLTEDDWCWLYWFLGLGAGSEAVEDSNVARREKVMNKSRELVNKLSELRSELDRLP
jgi:hypothetical protein